MAFCGSKFLLRRYLDVYSVLSQNSCTQNELTASSKEFFYEPTVLVFIVISSFTIVLLHEHEQTAIQNC